MRSVFTLVTVAAIMLGVAGVGSGARVHAQTAQTPVAGQASPGLTVTGEMFCSETKLRTSNVRLRWSLTPDALAAARLFSLSTAKQTLETTVYKNGFDKGLSIALPVGAATVEQPVAPVLRGSGQAEVRAFQIRLIEVEQTPAVAAQDAGSEMSAVVEGLEPGVNYTWRGVVETAEGRLVSPSVTYRAPVCPADIIRGPVVPGRRP